MEANMKTIQFTPDSVAKSFSHKKILTKAELL